MAIEKSSGEDAKTVDDSNDSAPSASKASGAKSNESKPSADEIRTRAYEIFQARHGGPGSEIGDWQKAEASLSAGATKADSSNATDGSLSGLTSDEAAIRLKKFGPNATPDTAVHPLRSALSKFWTPVPWMLEAAIVLEVALGKYVEATVIAALLVFNAALGFFQESRAQATLAALKSRLALNASVRRGGAWASVPAVSLVPGDIVKLSLGAVVAADVRIVEGSVLLDQSMLTGESIPIEGGPGLQTYAGALVRRGEAVAEVTATGTRTKFGRTAELVRTAHVTSSEQKARWSRRCVRWACAPYVRLGRWTTAVTPEQYGRLRIA